jgi:hypothetical protein
MTSDPIRFADILTTASAVASYLGEPEVTAPHLLSALAILRGESTIDDLGRPVSPLVRRGQGGVSVSPAVRDLAQRWFAELGANVDAALDDQAVERLLADLKALS